MVKREFVRLFIKGITMDREKETPKVLLKDDKNDYELSLDIGPFEANALIIELEKIRMPRPLTHDIISQFMKKHGFSLQFIELSERPENGYAARLFYTHGREEFTLDVRPSDALVLAAKTGAALFVRKKDLTPCGADSAAASGVTSYGEAAILFASDEGPPTKLM